MGKVAAELERWKNIEGYEGLYQVSNLGQVKSLPHFRKNGKGGYINKGTILKSSMDRGGYLIVALSKDGKQRTHRVHRLVAEAFLPNSNNLPVVNHKNEIKNDNRLENLEWCSADYNINYGTRNKRVSDTLTKKVSAVLSKPIYSVDTYTNETVYYYSSTIAGKLTGIPRSNILACLKKRRKTAGGKKWYFYN